jgi:hypothetical protein
MPATVEGDHMQSTPGTRCAGLLVAMALPFAASVRCLMGELDLTYDEAAEAMLTAQTMQPRDAPGRRATHSECEVNAVTSSFFSGVGR